VRNSWLTLLKKAVFARSSSASASPRFASPRGRARWTTAARRGRPAGQERLVLLGELQPRADARAPRSRRAAPGRTCHGRTTARCAGSGHAARQRPDLARQSITSTGPPVSPPPRAATAPAGSSSDHGRAAGAPGLSPLDRPAPRVGPRRPEVEETKAGRGRSSASVAAATGTPPSPTSPRARARPARAGPEAALAEDAPGRLAHDAEDAADLSRSRRGRVVGHVEERLFQEPVALQEERPVARPKTLSRRQTTPPKSDLEPARQISLQASPAGSRARPGAWRRRRAGRRRCRA
jgi:hypothetical protein